MNFFYFLLWLGFAQLLNSFHEVTGQCNSYRVRRDIRDLLPDEKEATLDAIVKLYNSGVTQEFNRIHYQLFKQVHRTPLFLIWHRALVYAIETKFLEVINKTSITGFPYFASILEPAGPAMFNSIFNDAYFSSAQGCLKGRFETMQDANGNCLSRNVEVSKEFLHTTFEETMNPMKEMDYNEFNIALEVSIHDALHNLMMGSMAMNHSSALDPMFYFHHSFVDFAYAYWQGYPGNELKFFNIQTSYPEFAYDMFGSPAEHWVQYKSLFCYTYSEPRYLVSLEPPIYSEETPAQQRLRFSSRLVDYNEMEVIYAEFNRTVLPTPPSPPPPTPTSVSSEPLSAKMLSHKSTAKLKENHSESKYSSWMRILMLSFPLLFSFLAF